MAHGAIRNFESEANFMGSSLSVANRGRPRCSVRPWNPGRPGLPRPDPARRGGASFRPRLRPKAGRFTATWRRWRREVVPPAACAESDPVVPRPSVLDCSSVGLTPGFATESLVSTEPALLRRLPEARARAHPRGERGGGRLQSKVDWGGRGAQSGAGAVRNFGAKATLKAPAVMSFAPGSRFRRPKACLADRLEPLPARKIRRCRNLSLERSSRHENSNDRGASPPRGDPPETFPRYAWGVCWGGGHWEGIARGRAWGPGRESL